MVELIDTAVSPFTDPECGDLTDAMRDNAGDELDLAGSFVSVSSHFYPDLEAYYERKAELWREARLEDTEEEDSNDDE
jgi:hypothetical protein